MIIYTLRYGLKITRKINRKKCAACSGDDCKCESILIGIKPNRLDELIAIGLSTDYPSQTGYFSALRSTPQEYTIMTKLLQTNTGSLDNEFMQQTLNYDLNKILKYDYPCFNSQIPTDCNNTCQPNSDRGYCIYKDKELNCDSLGKKYFPYVKK